MRSLSRRLGASSVLAGILFAASLTAAPAASAATYSTTVTQTAPTTLRAGNPQYVVASVTADGAPVADGTLVHFNLHGNPGEFTIGEDDLLTGAGIGNGAAHGANGYWLADASGVVKAYGSAPDLGDLPRTYGLIGWTVGIAPTATGNGFWLATIDGKVYPFGDAPQGVTDYGPMDQDWIAGLVPAAGGTGYRLITGHGRALPAAAALGNTATVGAPLFSDGSVVGLAATPSGAGYWVWNTVGHVSGFGDANFYGDLRALKLAHVVTALAPAPSGTGYWLMTDDGGVFSFGTAGFFGSGQAPGSFFTTILPTATGQGYHLFTVKGAVANFGDAVNYGSLFDVPTKGGKATFGYSSLAPGTTTVTAMGPPSMTGSSMASVTQTWTPADGYWMLGADGAVYPFGGAVDLGNAKQFLGGHQAVDLEPTPDYGGYWVVDDIGRVFAFGDASAQPGNADAAALAPGEKVTSLSATPSGDGYWIFTTKGRVFAKGDATHFGDMSGTPLNRPVLDSIPTPTGNGYYMVSGDGGIFAFGDATFSGSMGGKPLNAPVQSLVPDPDGSGYWLVAADGGIFAFDADFHGSMGATSLNKPVTGMVAFGDAYLMVGEDGGIFNFSSRPFYGSLGAHPPSSPIVSVAILDPFGR
ncbi:MAG: hypothetical protein QOD57_5204 [Actinomycetota bacterium]|nr:hypothetical protein [Actinomycetota bacterium]